MSELLSIRNAQEKILSVIATTPPEKYPVLKSYGRTLAEDIHSPFNMPMFDNSSMDGFAVRSVEVRKATQTSPVILPVTLDVPAGFSSKAVLGKGAVARILTGAPIPSGADAVIPIEFTDQNCTPQNGPIPQSVALFSPIEQGANIRRAGEDIQASQQILKKGRVLQSQDIGLLVSLGIQQVQVVKKARIALFSSGDELLLPGQPMSPGKIYDSNTYVLAGVLEAAGAEVIQLGIAQDNPQSVAETLDRAMVNPPDLIISSAGVSVGAFDFVRQVIEENGNISFWKVNMRPGKPFAFGEYKKIPFIGLPGNPVSAFVGSQVFVLPVIRKLHGLPPFTQNGIKVILAESLESPDGRESYYRGIVRKENGLNKAYLTGHQGSGNLFSLIQANALLIVPAGIKKINAGEEITAWPLEAGLD